MFLGANLIPEGLETGEYKIAGTAEINGLQPVYIVAYTRNPYDDGLTTQQTTSSQGATYNGTPSGLFFAVATADYLHGLLHTINDKGFGESIANVFTVPAISVVGYENNWTLEDVLSGVQWWLSNKVEFNAPPHNLNLITRPSSIDGYTPRNKKLLTYPYLYLGFNPINGTEKIYRYEDFSNGTPSFKIMSEINPNPTILFVPQNYRGKTGNSMSDCVALNGYPTISWVTDFYSSWIAQNSNIIDLQMQQENYNYQVDQYKRGAEFGMDVLGSALGMGGALGKSVIEYGFETGRADRNHEYYIKNQMAQMEKHQMLPNTSHLGTSATALGYDLINDNVFTRYNIKRQFAERLDKYFDMYGYLTNTVKTPNLNNRPNWNYVKTIGANIIGNIPQTDLQEIKDFFNNGITLWHTTSNYLNYSANNR